MRFIGRFRFYSPFNAMLIHTQIRVRTSSALLAGGGGYRRRSKSKPADRDPATDGTRIVCFRCKRHRAAAQRRPLPRQVEDPFQVRNGKVGGQLALTIDNAKRDGVRVSERADGSQRRDPSNRPQPGRTWNLRSPRSRCQSRRRSLYGSSFC